MPYKDPKKKSEKAKECGRRWYHENKEHAQTVHAEWRAKNPNYSKEYHALKRSELKQKKQGVRLECIQAYGGRCTCCGETNPAFLTIDHPNNDGFKEKSGGSLIFALKKEGWPKRVRLLCWNCNCGRAKANAGGECPHKNIQHVRNLLLMRPEAFA